MVAHASDPRFLVLHGLRLKGFATPPALASLLGLDAVEIDAILGALRDDGLAQHRDGRVSGWSLTPSGRTCHADTCAREVQSAGCWADVDRAYREFLTVNQPFLELCTDWQLRPGPGGGPVANDHGDSAYDAGVVSRLAGIDDSVQPLCRDLSDAMARFGPYGGRLAEARRRVEGGDQAWFTGALVESYHAVWFELHEDLLATLGIARDKEGGA